MYKLRIALLLLVPSALWAQQYTISMIAGGGSVFGPNAGFYGVATDAAGNLYFSNGGGHRIWKRAPDGTITPVAGNGQGGYSGDGGPATSAQLHSPWGVAVDGAGNLYIGDDYNHRVRRVSVDGIITTYAGNGTPGHSGDGGPATSAQLYGPMSVSIDTVGTLYIADAANSRIRKVSPSGIITTVAGNGNYRYSGDGGPAISAEFSFPVGVAVDGAGNLYIADACAFDLCSFRVRRITPDGMIGTIAGNGTEGYSGDGGPATSAQLSELGGIALDGAGNLYIADTSNHRIRKVSSDGIIVTVAGDGTGSYSGDGGQATSAQLNHPAGVAADRSGNLYIADSGNKRIRKVFPDGTITTVIETELTGYAGDGGPAASALLSLPRKVVLDAAGNAYIADHGNYRVRKVSRTGIISTIAGNGTPGYSGDGGLATSAALHLVEDLAVDAAGNVYLAEPYLHRVRKVSPNGTISTLAGNGTAGYAGDGGPAASAQLNRPVGVAVDHAGNLYIADYLNSRIRKVTPDGIISTSAGTGTSGYSGDGGPATSAQLAGPYGLAVSNGSLYFTDVVNHRIRKIAANGIITSIAGNGTPGFSGDGGLATASQLFFPVGVASDAIGNLYIADSGNHRMRRVSADGMITTIAGNGIPGYAGDGGRALFAQLSAPYGPAVDAAGNVYIATGNVIRLLEPDGPSPAITAVANAASNLQGSVAPGEIVTIYHGGIGPAQMTEFRLNETGLVSNQLDRAQVTFNGVPAPLVWTWTSSVSAVVPYSINGTSAQLQLTFRGSTSAPFSVQVAPSAPGLFTWNSTGTGPVVVGNPFCVPFCAVQGPVWPGDVIILFATGEGQTSPPGVDGKLGPPFPTGPTPVLPVSATIGGQPAKVNWKGGVEGSVAGVMGIAVEVPGGVTPGNALPVTVKIGDASSQSGVTIPVHAPCPPVGPCR